MKHPDVFRALAAAGGTALPPSASTAAATVGEVGMVTSPGMAFIDILLIVSVVIVAGGYLYRRFRTKNPCAGCGCAASRKIPPEEEGR